jgi:hypothetical protein
MTATQAGGGQAAISNLTKQGVSPIEAKIRVGRAGEGELKRQSSASATNKSLQSGKSVSVNTSAGSGLLGKLGLQNQQGKLNSKGELEVKGTNSNFSQDKTIKLGGRGYNRLTAADGSVKYVPGKGSAPLKLQSTPRPGSGRLDDPIAGKGPKGNEVGSTPPKPPVSTDASAGSGGSGGAGRGGAGGRPPADNGPKLIPTKPAAATPAKPAMGTTAGGTKFERRAATGDELRAAQDARAAAKEAGNTKGAEEAAVKAGVEASKPETSSLGQRAAAMPAMGSSQFKPATTSQATNAAGSNSAAASGSVVPQNDKLAASKKPVDIKASYEYDAYDLVLEYLLSQGHAETVAEAQYIMTEMDAEMIGDIVEEVLEEGDNYDKNRKRAAQRAAARNEARAKGQTGNVPGVGYVTPRRESETYRDSAGTERHKTGARMPEKKG